MEDNDNEQSPSQSEPDEDFMSGADSEEDISESSQTCTSIRISLTTEIRRTLGRFEEQQQNQSTTIHKVSLYLHDTNNDMYIPKLISIGPYHYSKKTYLANLKDAKIKYFHDLMRRRPDLYLDTFIHLAQDHRIEAKYSSSTEMSHEQFVKVMLVDSCFLIEFLIKWFLGGGKYQLKQLLSTLPVLKNDLLLVENQVPFFFMEQLFEYFIEIPEFKKITVEDHNKYNSTYPPITLVEIALAFLMGDMKDALWAARKIHENNIEFDHLLSLYYYSLNLHLSKHMEKENSRTSCWSLFQIPYLAKILKFVNKMHDHVQLHQASASCHISDSSVIRKIHNLLMKIIWAPTSSFVSFITIKWEKMIAKLNKDDRQEKWLLSGIPNACYLRDTGFSFKKKYTMEYEFMDITQKGTVISIPILHIDETTTVNFKNLIAFEQCLQNESNFTAYATLMSNLIDAEEDVVLLKECGIINNRLGTDQKVVDFFGSLCRGIYLDQEPHYLSSLFGYIRKHYAESYYKVKFYRLRKKYIPDYFTKPCAGLCLLVSVMVILITIVQVFFTIYRYFRPPHHN